MSTDPAYLAAPPPLTGRAAALDDLVALAATRPGAVVVTNKGAKGNVAIDAVQVVQAK